MMIASPNYQSRGGTTVRLLVVHTTENNADITPAVNVANYFAQSSSQVSAHVVIDDSNTIQCVDYSQAAWTVADYNNVSESAEMVGYAAYGPADWSRHAGTIERCAQWLRERASARGIPLTFLSAADVAAGRSGWTSHLNLGAAGGGHHDPGDAAIAALQSALEDDMATPQEIVDYSVGNKPDGTPITLSTMMQDFAKVIQVLGTDPRIPLAKAVIDFQLDGPSNTIGLAAQAITKGTAKVQATATVDPAVLTAAVAAALKAAGAASLAPADVQAACTAAVRAVFAKASS
jgi:hypothetical protein